MTEIILQAKSDADSKLHLEVGRPNTEYEVVVREKTMNGNDLLTVERVLEARYVQPSQLYLRFADGLEGTWTFEQLELDMSNINVAAVKASSAGVYIEVQSNAGEDVQLDSSSLRESVDPEYAASLEREIASIQIPSEQLERIAAKHQPPQAWYDSKETVE